MCYIPTPTCEICGRVIFDFDYIVIIKNDNTASTKKPAEYYHLKCWEKIREKNILTFSSNYA